MIEVLIGALVAAGAAILGLWKAYSHQRDARRAANELARSAQNQANRERAMRDIEHKAYLKQKEIPRKVKDEVKKGNRGQFTDPD